MGSILKNGLHVTLFCLAVFLFFFLVTAYVIGAINIFEELNLQPLKFEKDNPWCYLALFFAFMYLTSSDGDEKKTEVRPSKDSNEKKIIIP